MCMCGCAGTYFYTAYNVAFSNKHRGYEVTADEVNDIVVLRVINKMSKNAEAGIELCESMDNGLIYNMVIGKTQYTLYTKK